MAELQRRRLAVVVAAAFLDGSWVAGAMVARAAYDLGIPAPPWLVELAAEALEAFPGRPVDQPRALERLIAGSAHAPARLTTGRHAVAALVPSAMGPARWPVLRLDDVGALAAALGVPPTRLAWYADVRSWERRVSAEALRHYRYRWHPRPGGVARLLEAPKDRLKRIQRALLRDIVDAVPAHPAALGFRRGGSVHRFAAPHLARRVVIGLDLEGFFAAVGPGRVFAVYRAAGYPESVAHVLTGLATNAVPAAVLSRAPQAPGGDPAARWRQDQRLGAPHLPQGAPTSPALANLVAHGLDRRLAALAERFGARYTRYADDLAFSGGDDLLRSSARLVARVGAVVDDEGFRLNAAKTRVMPSWSRQLVAGLVVNEQGNVPRTTYDRLRAVLHDAAAHGPAAANRHHHPDFRNHLLGRIAWVESASPTRGAKLRTQFARIDWS